VSDQYHTPAAFSLGKTPVPIEKEAEWAPRTCLDNIEKRKIWTLPEVEPWIIQPLA